MAATIQTPAQQPPTTNNTSPANPQLKRIVYSKYRELLGSYNDKANAIIESLPAYMVKEDRGFHFDPKIIDEVDKVVYGTPPAPPPLSTGSVPTQRLSTQMPQYNVGEAPACVQNAMMTKDKKPFTYTPGGIDLSQIKSQRMAKRLARNAQSEGATGQQQMNRPSPSPQLQQSNGGGGTPPAASAQLGATAMGMPFQVFPTGPPPPPPPQPNKVGVPPPPPPAPQNKLAPQSNGNAAHARKSPTPQNFEPPPLGFRPEIKIPSNPMAALKKVPPPQEKNNFWVEEYRKDRSKSPMVGNDENDYNRSPPNNPQPETNQYTYNNFNNNSQQNDYQPQQQNQYRSPSPQPMRPQQEYYTQRAASPPRTPVQQLEQQRRIESPYQTQYSPQSQPQQQSPSIQRQTSQYQPPYQQPQSSPQQQQSPTIQRQQSNLPQQYQGPTSPQYQQPQQTSPTQQQQAVPWRSQRQVAPGIQNNVTRPRDVMSPAPCESPRPQPQLQQQPQQQQQQQQPQQQYPAYLRSREVLSPAPELQPPHMSQPYQQKNSQVGSIYIPPVATQQQQQSPPYQDAQGAVRQQQPSRQVPANRWMSSPQSQPAESQPLNRIKSPPPPSSNGFASSNNTGLRLQINNNTSNANAKERIIPIQLEQTPTRTPSAAPGFGPQPFYNANQQQYSSVPSPPLAQGATSNGPNSPNYIVRSPNQFVDQGYNNYPGSQDPNRVTSPTVQQMQSPRIVQQTNTAGGVKTRIIPIALDAQPDGPLNPNNVRGPISQQPLVIQNDPRNQNTWGNGSATPNQSKSFRILQKITDTTDDSAPDSKAVESDSGDQEPQLQRPTYARQMAPGQLNSPTIDQMKRMQINNEQAFANRARNQDEDEEAAVTAANEDPRYRGPSNPSKTFKKLQGAVERCSPIKTVVNDGNSPVMKQPQPNRYVNQRQVYSPEEQPQQYVHPSEQQVPEPKKYTGSAIPSRSFKILQAMTTPENAAEMEGSDVVESNKSITECPYQQPPPPPFGYPYPYMPPCCPPAPPPSSSSGGDVHNWQYPSPHPHPHPHHHHPYQHHPYPPCPYYYYYPPNEYDSQNCSQYQVRDSFSRCKSQSQDLPNIIITPSAEDIPHVVKGTDLGRDQREGSVIETLSRRLNEIAKPVDLDLNMSQQDDKEYVGDGGKEFGNSPSPIKSECENNKISSEDSSDDLLTSSTDPTTTSSFEDCAETNGLKAIKSVTNIQVYNKRTTSPMEAYDEDLTVADGESMIFDDDEEEEEIVGEELEYDEEEVLIEEMDSEEEAESEEDEDEEEEDEVIVMDDLSVIYEENEADLLSPRPTSRISSSVSESTTLANGECEEEEQQQEEEEEDEVMKEGDDEDNSNSVTVRLPLKFSFSRSSNDESIATVEVGNSQIQDKRRSFSIASVEADPEDDDSDFQDCDISVTISLSPSSGSFDKKSNSSPVPRMFGAFVREELKEDDSEVEDVSVAFSLPMRDKSMKSPCLEVTNAITKKKKKKSESKEDTAVEAWRRNNHAFAENEVVLEKKPQLDAGWISEPLEDVDKTKKNDFWSASNNTTYEVSSMVAKKVEQTTVETLKKTNSAFENRQANTVVLKRNDVSLVGVENREIKKIKLIEDTETMSISIPPPQEHPMEKDEAITTKEDEIERQPEENDGEELDFWATLQATRREAQLFLEKTADYWGKKINGKEKIESQPDIAPSDAQQVPEDQTEDDFWATIRVKENAVKVEPVEETTEKTEEVQIKKDSNTKTTKPKKKKKIVKAPEKEPEKEHVWSTIKLPNANNRSKIVESTIKMIQDKTKKPKEAVKVIKEEIEVGDFVASIKMSYDKEHKEETETTYALASTKVNCEMKKKEEVIREDVSDSVTVTKKQKEDIVSNLVVTKKEDIRSNLVKEKAELMTQILNQKFAKAFVIPETRVLMKAIVTESEIEPTILSPEFVKTSKVGQKWEFSAMVSNPISYQTETPKKSSPEVEIVIEESETLEKPKKKISKSKKIVEEAEGDTLKPPKPKTVKKSTKEPKKIKKKKQETPDSEIKTEEVSASEAKQDVEEKLAAVQVEQIPNTIEKECDEPDFWAEIESSKSSQTHIIQTEETTTYEVKTKTLFKPTLDHQETDFWATIKPSKSNDDEICHEETQEIDFWAEIEPSDAEAPKHLQKEDFWAEIGPSQPKNESKVDVHNEVIDIWAEDEASKVYNHQETNSCIKIDSFEVENEVISHEIDIWSEDETSKAYQDNENCSKINSSSKQELMTEVLESPNVKISIEHQETDFWAEIDSTTIKSQETGETTTDFWSEIKSSETESVIQVELSVIPTTKADEVEEIKPSKPKTKKKSKNIVQDDDFATEAVTPKLKTKKKSSTLKESPLETCSFETTTECHKLKTKTKNTTLRESLIQTDVLETTTKPEALIDNNTVKESPMEMENFEIITESPKLKSKKKSTALQGSSTETEVLEFVTESPKLKTKKKITTLQESSTEGTAVVESPKLKNKKKSTILLESSIETEGYAKTFESVKLKTKEKSTNRQEFPMEIEFFESIITKPIKQIITLPESPMQSEITCESPKLKTKKKTMQESSTEVFEALTKLQTKNKCTGLQESSMETETFETISDSPKPKAKKKSSSLRESPTETEVSETKSESPKPKTKKKTKALRESPTDTADCETISESPKLKSKKMSTALEQSPTESDISRNKAESPKLKIKKKISSPQEEPLLTEVTPLKLKSKKKSSQLKTELACTDFWSSTETAKPKISKKSTKIASLHVYGEYDVELINLEPIPTYYALHTEPQRETDFWATLSYADDNIQSTPKVFEERESDFWASNSSGNETEVNSEVDTGKIDFWVTQRKFEANSAFAKGATPKVQEECEEVDFWAEIKGSDEEDEVPAVLPKDECEVRRNNYKKAMAFFTNTVNVDKKVEIPVQPRNVEPLPVYEKEPLQVYETEPLPVYEKEPLPVYVQEKTPEPQAYNSWGWRASVEHDWEAPVEREMNDVFLVVEDNETEEEPETLIENNPYEMEEGCEFEAIDEEQAAEEEEEEESSESISDSTPNHFQIEHQYPKPEPEPFKQKEKSLEPISSNKINEETKISVKDRIFAFETGTIEPPMAKPKTSLIVDSATPKSNLSRNSSQRSESEVEEDDSGVTDMNKPLSETDTESESFPELRKMSRYQRANTHSRLFKLLQDDGDDIIEEEQQQLEDKLLEAEFNFKPRKKIVHNVSITRKQNPKALKDAESMTKRRERLSLPLRKNSSIDADNLSSPNSPASPIFGQPSQAVSDQLVNELVQSLLLKKSSSTLKNLPMEKLQAAAKRVLEEELDSLENTSVDSTPALTPQEFKSESYSDYYDSWSAKTDSDTSANGSFEILPSKAFKALQETTATAKRRPWAVRCPRVLSSKTVNRDLARVTESPEIFSRSSNSPEIMFGTERGSSVGRWRKV